MKHAWCIEKQTGEDEPVVIAVATSEATAEFLKNRVEEQKEEDTTFRISKINVNLMYLDYKVVKFGPQEQENESSVLLSDIPTFYCIYMDGDYSAEPLLAGIATSKPIMEEMKRKAEAFYEGEMNITVEEMPANEIVASKAARTTDSRTYSIEEIDGVIQKAFQICAFGDSPVKRFQCFDHTIEVNVDTNQHIIERVEVEGEEIYNPVRGSGASLQSIGGLATLKMCDILEAEGRYEPCDYNFDFPEPASPLDHGDGFWDEGWAKDINWFEDFMLDPHIKTPDDYER